MPDKKRRLEQTVESLQLRFGSRAVRRLREPLTPARLPTGFSALDDALGGGLPRGRIVEIVGAPTVGLTTLALKIVAQAHARGEAAAYLDLEQTFDPDYAARCGVLLHRLLLVRPYDVGQTFALLRDLAAGDYGVLVCDLPSGDVADARVRQSLPAGLGRLLVPLAGSPAVLLFLVSLPTPSGLDQTPLLHHYATVRLLLRRERWLYRGPDVYGSRARVVVAKNKLGVAGQAVTLDFMFDGPLERNGRPGGGPER